MVWESSPYAESIHKTKKVAEMAMEFHKQATIDEDGRLDDCKLWDVVEYRIEE